MYKFDVNKTYKTNTTLLSNTLLPDTKSKFTETTEVEIIVILCEIVMFMKNQNGQTMMQENIQ